MHWRLDLETLKVKGHIGVTEAERAVAQDLEISFSVTFARQPEGCNTDEIDDTACYGMLCDTLREICEQSEFKLIEALAQKLSLALRSKLPADAKTQIRVKKVQPPVSGLAGGATFQISA